MKTAVVFITCVIWASLVWLGYKWGEFDANYEHYKAVKRYEQSKCKDGTVYQRSLSGYWEDMKKACRTEEQM